MNDCDAGEKQVATAENRFRRGENGLSGGEEFGFSTGALIVLGCVMMRKCHLNTCPMGIATQNEELRKRFIGKADFVVNYFRFVAQEVRECLAEMGYSKLDEIVGHPELLEVDPDVQNWKSLKIDFSKILYRPEEADLYPLRNVSNTPILTII